MSEQFHQMQNGLNGAAARNGFERTKRLAKKREKEKKKKNKNKIK